MGVKKTKNIILKIMDLMDENEEIFADGNSNSKEDNEFDDMVALVEEVIFSEEFQNLQDNFFKKHCTVFEDTEENKLEYTPIFKEYTKIMERTLESQLKKQSKNIFNMKKFENMVADRMDELQGIEVFDTLLSFTDFEEFKIQILGYKTGASIGSFDLEVKHVSK